MLQVGDRPFTDIAYGNRNGFLTILTNPLSLDEEPLIVNQVSLIFLCDLFTDNAILYSQRRIIFAATVCIKFYFHTEIKTFLDSDPRFSNI